MLVDICRRLRFFPLEDYQYIGFGGVAFVDFRLFHKGLGIRHMVSIQNTSDLSAQSRFAANKPFNCIKMLFGKSSEVLKKIAFKRPTIVWLDFDSLLNSDMCIDLEVLATQRLPVGSVVFVSFQVQVPQDATETENFIEREGPTFGSLSEKQVGDVSSNLIAEAGRKTFFDRLSIALGDADAGLSESKRRFAEQVAFFRYSDGAKMATVGWIICNEGKKEVLKQCQLDKSPLVRSRDSHYEIKVPILTPHEVRLLEKRLTKKGTAANAPSWLPKKEKTSFESCHRFLPDFAVLES
jgi:hypothetical protein